MIETATIEYDDAWKGMSEQCQDFVKKLLEKSSEKRLSSSEALNHPWIQKYRQVGLANITNVNRE